MLPFTAVPSARRQARAYCERVTNRMGKAVPAGKLPAARNAAPLPGKMPNTAEPLPVISDGLAPSRLNLRTTAAS